MEEVLEIIKRNPTFDNNSKYRQIIKRPNSGESKLLEGTSRFQTLFAISSRDFIHMFGPGTLFQFENGLCLKLLIVY